ncbi:glycosyltransferase family 4 protein [Jannaschia seosinensis]|nr:glycosyltransferase family 4 protein [Jannaschia seosinensis]
MRQPSVLLIAEAANPEWVSVPLVGWSMASALRDVARVHVVTQVRNRAAFLRAGLVEGEDFTALDTEKLARPMWRVAGLLRGGAGKGWTTSTAIAALSYPYFEHLLWKRFGDDVKAGRFDVVHRITPLTPTTVSPLAARCAAAGVPFVLGPLNGGVPWPSAFAAERRAEKEWLSYVRGVYKLFPGRRRMLQSCAAILVGSRHTGSEIPAAYQDRTFRIPENAIDPARFDRIAAQDISGPLRSVFVGRLVPYKGPDMAIEASAPLLRSGRMHLDIVGDGPMRADLQALVERLGVEKAVTFHGPLGHREVQDVMAKANLLVFPSIREFGGGVVLEAMSLGVVPVVVDYAGPGELVDAKTGIALPLSDRNGIVQNLTDRLTALADDPTNLPAMGQAARAHVQSHFTWSAKANQVAEIYDWVTGQRRTRPQIFD